MIRKKASEKQIQAIIEAGYMKQARGNSFMTKKTFSPSKLGYGEGKCPNYWFIAFSGADFEETTDASGVARMAYGSEAHARIQKMFMESEYNTQEEVEITSVDPPIRGFVDLVIDLGEDPEDQGLPIEVKTARFESYGYRAITGKGLDYQILQLLIYMRILKKTRGFLLYENKNDQDYTVIEVTISDERKVYVEYLFNWMREVRKEWEDGNFPVRPYKEKSKVCQGCPVRKACWTDREEVKVIKPLVLPEA